MIVISNIKYQILKIRKSKGFTLIELLVVISIIGVLASLTLASYTGAQKQTRDTQRRSDLNQYRNALEGYAASNNGLYPGRSDCVGGVSCEGSSSVPDGIFSESVGPIIIEYLASLIQDPLEGNTTACNGGLCTYYYRVSVDPATDYTLIARLETGGYWEICSNGQSGKTTWSDLNEVCDLGVVPTPTPL